MQMILGALVAISIAVFTTISWRMADELSETYVGVMDVAFRQVASSMQHLLEANRSAFSITSTVQQTMNDKSDLFSQARTITFRFCHGVDFITHFGFGNKLCCSQRYGSGKKAIVECGEGMFSRGCRILFGGE
jgi:hypothetical protein